MEWPRGRSERLREAVDISEERSCRGRARFFISFGRLQPGIMDAKAVSSFQRAGGARKRSCHFRRWFVYRIVILSLLSKSSNSSI